MRESFHVLDYLAKQTVPRDRYEILWIEYYSRKASELQGKVDQWVLLEMPEDVYYHKHLMYNVGFAASRGRIVVICDSDVMVKPTFIQSIVEKFESEKNIFLHLDEVRNNSRRFHPFNYPSFEEFLSVGCINWRNGTTAGLKDTKDPLHLRNYGACFCALREDIVTIGGSDEHIDYLGHICGPYDLTFRLLNAGKKEVWHESEFLYHTWHPVTDGVRNYIGPSDKRGMSTTALRTRRTGRIFPLVENPAIRVLRKAKDPVSYVDVQELVIPELDISHWRTARPALLPKRHPRKNKSAFSVRFFLVRLKLLLILSQVFWKQLCSKAEGRSAFPVMKKNILEKLKLVFLFSIRMWKNNLYALGSCEEAVQKLAEDGTQELAIYGQGKAVEILKALLSMTPVHLNGIYDEHSKSNLKGYPGKVVIASFAHVTKQFTTLRELGIINDHIVRIQ